MRNAIDNEVVLRRIVELDPAERDVFGDHVAAALLINAFNDCLRERFFPAYENSNPLHICYLSFREKRRKIPGPLFLVKQASVSSTVASMKRPLKAKRAF